MNESKNIVDILERMVPDTIGGNSTDVTPNRMKTGERLMEFDGSVDLPESPSDPYDLRYETVTLDHEFT